MLKKPNFLFIFPDQHRGDWMPYSRETMEHLGVSELTLEMPNIRGIMERGVSFTHVVSPAPVCAPARACLASGRRYGSCRVMNNNVNYDYTLQTFYSLLKQDGYNVGGVGKFDLNKANLFWGDGGSGHHELLDRVGFTHTYDNEGKFDAIWAYYDDKAGPYVNYLAERGLMKTHAEDMVRRLSLNTDAPTPLSDEDYCDNWITGHGQDMIRDFPVDKPWFLQVNFACPHDPWDVTVSMKEQYKNRTYPPAAEHTLAEDNNGIRQNYAAMLENIDRNVGLLIDAVQARGDLENTIIIYSSDHGELLGDHNQYGKSKPEQGSIHVPLVIDASRFGGVQNMENASPVEMQDIAATVLEYAGLSMETELGSVSLKPVMDGEKTQMREYCVSELISPVRRGLIVPFGTVSDGRYKLIMTTGKPDRLYDLAKDPFECQNISAEQLQIVERLKKLFDEREPLGNPGVRKLFEKLRNSGTRGAN